MGCRIPLVLVLLAQGLAGQSQTVTVAPSTIPGVEIIGPENSAYSSAIDQILGTTRSEALNAWLPYGVVVKNGSAQPIVALAVQWAAMDASGRALTKAFLLDRSIAPGTTQIAVGESVVAIPRLIVMGGSRKVDLPEFQLTPPAGFVPPVDHELPRFQTAQTVQATLDGVVFASGQFVGPDTAQEYENIQADLIGPVEVAAKILAMQAAGEPIAKVVALLRTVAEVTSARQESLDKTTIAAGRAARGLLGNYERLGEQSMYQLAQSEAKPVIQLYR
jgi:hypothetical protein